MNFRDPHAPQANWFYRYFVDPRAWDRPLWGFVLLAMFMFGCVALMYLLREITQ